MVEGVRTTTDITPSEKQPQQQNTSFDNINNFVPNRLNVVNAIRLRKTEQRKNLEQDLLDQKLGFKAIIDALDNSELTREALSLSLMTKIALARQFTLQYATFRDISAEKLDQLFDEITEKLKAISNAHNDPFFVFYPVKKLMEQVEDAIYKTLAAKKCTISVENDVFFTYMNNFKQILSRGVEFYHFNPVYRNNALSSR
jgi:hypothetical protein